MEERKKRIDEFLEDNPEKRTTPWDWMAGGKKDEDEKEDRGEE